MQKYNFIRLGLCFAILTLFATVGCHDKGSPYQETKKTYPYVVIEPCKTYTKIIVDRWGGGAHHAEIEPVHENTLKVSKISYKYGKTYGDFDISLENNPILFTALKEIFAGNCTIHRLVEEPNDAPTGTWLNIFLFDQAANKYSKGLDDSFILKDDKKYGVGFLERELLKMYNPHSTLSASEIKNLLANAKNYAEFIKNQTTTKIENFLKTDPHSAEQTTLRGLLLPSGKDVPQKEKNELLEAIRKGDTQAAMQKLDDLLNLPLVSPYAVGNAKDDLPSMSITVEEILKKFQNSGDQNLQKIANSLKSLSELDPFFQANSHDLAKKIISEIDQHI